MKRKQDLGSSFIKIKEFELGLEEQIDKIWGFIVYRLIQLKNVIKF